tara:strand:- start:409 stop:1113 length:705 start_codon:yes stop_codon:yes gene_type:complete
MSDQTNCKAALDPNFIETIELLNKHEIPYWVCHGTLLGLIRDGSLIPWDHDIDIAIWAGDFSKQSLIDLMNDNGYSLKNDGSDYDFVAFVKVGGREIDFNYYRTSDDVNMAYSEWYIPRSRLTSLLSLISNRSEYNGKGRSLVRQLYFLSPVIGYIVRLLKRSGLFYKSAGYTTPTNLLKESTVLELSGINIRVPRHSEAVLEYLYGEDWRVPKQLFDWMKESPSTRISKSRFK